MAEIKTFSNIPIYEWIKNASEFEEILKRYTEEIKKITDSYVDCCINNNIELYSAFGWFLHTVNGELNISSLSKGAEERIARRKEGNNNGYI